MQIGPLDELALQRARVVQGRDRLDRAQVGEQAEALAQAEQALLGAGLVGVGGVPFRTADRGQQHGVGVPARAERLVGQGRAVGVDRSAAEDVLLVLEIRAGSLQYLEGRGGDLGADPVTGEEDDARGHGGGTLTNQGATRVRHLYEARNLRAGGWRYARKADTARSSAGASCGQRAANPAATTTVSPVGAWTRQAISV